MTLFEVRMKLKGDRFASQDELALRHEFQDQVEARGIGESVASGNGLGEMDVLVEVTDPKEAKSKLRLLAEELGARDIVIDEQFD